jgi:hypothetical protein
MSYFLKSWIIEWFKECFKSRDYKKLYLEEYNKYNQLKHWTEKYIKSNNELIELLNSKK